MAHKQRSLLRRDRASPHKGRDRYRPLRSAFKNECLCSRRLFMFAASVQTTGGTKDSFFPDLRICRNPDFPYSVRLPYLFRDLGVPLTSSLPSYKSRWLHSQSGTLQVETECWLLGCGWYHLPPPC